MSSTATQGAEVARFTPEKVIDSLRGHLNPFLTNGIHINDGGIRYVVNELRADGYFTVSQPPLADAIASENTVKELPCNQHYLGLVLDQWALISGATNQSGMSRDKST